MLYKSKFRLLWFILSINFALVAVVFAIINLFNQQAIYLTIAICLASLFFFCRGASGYIEAKYAARKDRSFLRTLAYIHFGFGVMCFLVFVIQLVTNL